MNEEQLLELYTHLANRLAETFSITVALLEDYSEVIATTEYSKESRIEDIKERARKILSEMGKDK